MIGFLDRLVHQYIRGHDIAFRPALAPDEVIADKAGKPLINVFTQDTFQRPDPHYECNCGKTWT
jgi:hypothetical protein